jgi:hypothetical protein
MPAAKAMIPLKLTMTFLMPPSLLSPAGELKIDCHEGCALGLI